MVARTVPSKAGPGFYARLAGNLLSPLPYSVSSHASPALAEAVRDFAAENRIDLWHCEWTPYAQVLRAALGDDLDRARWTVMAHNVESLIWRRYGETETNPAKRWYIRRQGEKFERFERWAYGAATVPIAVSDADAAIVRSEFGVRRVEVVANGVDIDYFKPQRDVDRDPARLLFLGSLDWRPNLDAASLLLDDIFPHVRAACPTATLSLVGRKPPAWLIERVANAPARTRLRQRRRCAAVPRHLRHAGRAAPDRRRFPPQDPGGARDGNARGQYAHRRGRVDADARYRPHGDGNRGRTGRGDRVGTARADELHETAERGRRVVVQHYSWDLLADRLGEVWDSARRARVEEQV